MEGEEDTKRNLSLNISDTKESSTKSNGRTNEDEEGHLTITSTTLPEAIPTTHEVKDVEEERAANPLVDEPPMESSAADVDVPTTISETNAPAVCSDPPAAAAAANVAESMENSSPRPASEQLEVVPVSKLVEQLKEVETIADETTPKEQIEVTINQDLVKEPVLDDPMEAEENQSEENAMVIDEKANGDEPAEMAGDQTEQTTKEEVPPPRMVR